jgi:methylisocitrate lyase
MADLWTALHKEKPLQIVGVINPLCALMAKAAGFEALYLSGAGVANANFGIPDLAMTNLTDVLSAIRPITAICDLPLLVDADTGWGSPLSVERSIAEIERAGAAAVHLEDQIAAKRCGHREHKQIVSLQVMCDRLQAACQARSNQTFKIIARTDALGIESKEATLERAIAYMHAGADAIFLEAATDLEIFRYFSAQLPVPILANMTEFGKTPYYTQTEFGQAGVSMVLYPLTAFRAMNHAAMQAYQTVRKEGTQKNILKTLQTRQDLYQLLDYEQYEERLDRYQGVEE